MNSKKVSTFQSCMMSSSWNSGENHKFHDSVQRVKERELKSTKICETKWSTGWSRSYRKCILQITQPSQYRYAKLQYSTVFAVTSGSPSSLDEKKINPLHTAIMIACTNKEKIVTFILKAQSFRSNENVAEQFLYCSVSAHKERMTTPSHGSYML